MSDVRSTGNGGHPGPYGVYIPGRGTSSSASDSASRWSHASNYY